MSATRGSSGPRKHVAGLPLPIADDWRPSLRLMQANRAVDQLSDDELEEAIVAFREHARATDMRRVSFGRSFVDWVAKRRTS